VFEDYTLKILFHYYNLLIISNYNYICFEMTTNDLNTYSTIAQNFIAIGGFVYGVFLILKKPFFSVATDILKKSFSFANGILKNHFVPRHVSHF
jgi:hypothetical protein